MTYKFLLDFQIRGIHFHKYQKIDIEFYGVKNFNSCYILKITYFDHFFDQDRTLMLVLPIHIFYKIFRRTNKNE